MGIFHTLHTEQSLNIYNSDTSQLNKMAGNIRSRAYQGDIADPTDLHHVVTDQTMASFNQLQSRLALADSTLSHNQHAFAEHIHQHAVNGNCRSKLYAQPPDNLCRKCRGTFIRTEGRHLILVSQFQQLLARLSQRGKNYAGNFLGHKSFICCLSLFQIQMLQISILYITNNLHPLIGKMLKIPCQLQSWTVDLRNIDFTLCHINIRRHVFQIHGLHHGR